MANRKQRRAAAKQEHTIAFSSQKTAALVAAFSTSEIDAMEEEFRAAMQGIRVYEHTPFSLTIKLNSPDKEDVVFFIDIARRQSVVGFVSEVQAMVGPERWEGLKLVSPEQIEAMKESAQYTQH